MNYAIVETVYGPIKIGPKELKYLSHTPTRYLSESEKAEQRMMYDYLTEVAKRLHA